MMILWIILVVVFILLLVCLFIAYRIEQRFDRIELEFNEEEEKI